MMLCELLLPFSMLKVTSPQAVPCWNCYLYTLWTIVLSFPGMLRVWLVDLMRGSIGVILRVLLKNKAKVLDKAKVLGLFCSVLVYLTSIPRICVVWVHARILPGVHRLLKKIIDWMRRSGRLGSSLLLVFRSKSSMKPLPRLQAPRRLTDGSFGFLLRVPLTGFGVL